MNVSIVIPTFNRSGMLRRAVESALAQTHACEVVVCDHGSTDDTPAVARSFGSRIRYLRREEDGGIHLSWLDGVVSARGDLVHLNFDDDYLRPTFVERCLALMGPEVGLCMTMALLEDAATGNPIRAVFGEMGATGVHPMRRFLRFQLASVVSPGAVLLRRQDVIDALFVGKIPFTRHAYRGVGPDWLMTSLTSLRYPSFGFVAEPLAVFSAHAGSITIEAGRDASRARQIELAYEEARRYLVLAYLARTLGARSVAGLLLAAWRAPGAAWSAVRRAGVRLGLVTGDRGRGAGAP